MRIPTITHHTVAAAIVLAACGSVAKPQIRNVNELGHTLDRLRMEYAIPALSAGMIDADGSRWVQGFGSTSDGRAPTPASVFHLASLTKPFAAAIIVALVEEGKLSLDDSVSKYRLTFPNSSDIRVRHLLTHTSEGIPGERYSYNGNRFAQLDHVILIASGKTFAQHLQERIIGPLGLGCTGPSTNASLRASLVPGFENGKSINYPTLFSSAAGMVSCIDDMLRFSAAWDDGSVISATARNNAWTPARSNAGATLPYGLGWFTEEFEGTKIVWHYGHWTGISSLIIKLPDTRMTYVLLANSNQLSAQFNLGAGKLRSSPFARAFLSYALKRGIPPQ